MKCYHHYLAWKKQHEAHTSQQDFQVANTAVISPWWNKSPRYNLVTLLAPTTVSLLHWYLNVLDEMLSSLFGAKKAAWSSYFAARLPSRRHSSDFYITKHEHKGQFWFLGQSYYSIPPPLISKCLGWNAIIIIWREKSSVKLILRSKTSKSPTQQGSLHLETITSFKNYAHVLQKVPTRKWKAQPNLTCKPKAETV